MGKFLCFNKNKKSSKSSLQGFWASLKIIVPCIAKRKKIIDEENLVVAADAYQSSQVATDSASTANDVQMDLHDGCSSGTPPALTPDIIPPPGSEPKHPDNTGESGDHQETISELRLENTPAQNCAAEPAVLATAAAGVSSTLTPAQNCAAEPAVLATAAAGVSSTLEEINDGEVFWFDEDLQPVSLQTQLEAEELRLKQLQIEQEIKQLEQAQESIPSYYYVREIPNKPPPPYTPPGQSVTKSNDQLDPVPKKQEEVERLVNLAMQQLFAVYSAGDDLSAVQPSSQYLSERAGNRAYKKFLFDLAKQCFIDLTSNVDNEKDTPPWEKTGSRIKYVVLPKLTEDFISNYVLKKIRVLFGFEVDTMRENLIIQWSRKKRNRVDELLVRESQEEEQEWTDYSKCEVTVKNTVSLKILDCLMEDTALALNQALAKKHQYCEQNT